MQRAQSSLEQICSEISIVLASCLVLLVPFDASRNIDFQGIVLLIAGGFAALSIATYHRHKAPTISSLPLILMVIFGVACIMSLLVNPHLHYNILGAPYIRLGSLGLLSCIACAIVSRRIDTDRIVVYVYGGIVGIAALSIPYTCWQDGTLERIGGLFNQADVMGCFLGVGLLLGLAMLRRYPERRYQLLGAQFALLCLLIATETRAALGLVFILYLVQVTVSRQPAKQWHIIGSITAVAILLIGSHWLMPNRLADRSYAAASVSYRLVLQAAGVKASLREPVFGYGPGNLADALVCHNLLAAPLQKTCREGEFFNSSHNIFLDRFLAVGWLGGAAFTGLVALAAYRGLRGNYPVLGYCIVLIAGYYLTNVTSITLELLLWVLIIHAVWPASRASTSP